MADEYLWQMTELAAAPAADDGIYIGDASEALLDDQNKYILVQNLFGFLGGGNFTGNVVIDASATMDMQNGTIYVNEAVNLTATSTQLNNISALSGGDFTNFQHDHSNGANGGNLGNITTGQIQASADADIAHTFGRAVIGYDGANTDTAHFAHIDNMTANNYAVRQAANGATRINTPTGQAIEFRINSAAFTARVNVDGFRLNGGTIIAREDLDTEHVLGRAKIGYNGTNADSATFAHFDHMSSTNYAVRATENGQTNINAATGQNVYLRINNANIFGINASGLIGNTGARITQFDNDDTMAADSATRGVTQAAAKGYTDAEVAGRTRAVELQVYGPTTACATGNDLIAFTITPDLNGKNLTNVLCAVYDQGTGGTMDVMIHRRRSGTNADMLTTAVTIDPTEWFAQDGTIDTANDDVSTGDVIVVDVDAIHSTTAANGLFVTLEFT